MTVISRKDAISSGLNKYFTGEMCKNGHISERYVQSGSCEGCIRSASPFPVANPEQQRSRIQILQQRADIEQAKITLRQERLEFDKRKADASAERLRLRARAKRKDLAPYRAMLHYADVEFFKSTMLLYSWQIDPTLTIEDLLTNKAPDVAGERAIHTFRAFQVDHAALRELERQMDRERRTSGSDHDAINYRETMRLRAEEDARKLADEDNGRPEWDGGILA